MTVPTSAELELLRTKPHAAKMWLSVYQPSTMLACRLNNASIARGDRTIAYDGVTSGNYALVKSGMSMYVGSSAGAFDKGIIRVRSIVSGTITVAENSIAWADDDYLTVVNFYEINPVYPRIVPGSGTIVDFYKDYDIAYTNQNSVLGSFVCMGGHYAGFKNDSVFYSASGTSNLLGEALSYFWFFEGATVTGSTACTPGYLTYNTPGHYTTELIVSGTSSADVSYRHVSIYDRPEEGTTVPILSWEFGGMSGSRDEGGHTASITIRQAVPETLIRDGSLVVIFQDTYYDDLTTRRFIGGENNRGSVFFVGYVLKGSIKYDYNTSYVEFEVVSPTNLMKIMEGFAISVDSSINIATDIATIEDIQSGWELVLNMNLRRAIYHYLRWHTTVLNCIDVEFLGTDRAIQYFDADRDSVYSAVNTILSGAGLGKAVCNRQGKLYLERDVWIEPGVYQTSFTVSRRDWMDEPDITERGANEVSFLEIGGIEFNAPSSSVALLANAPGTAPAYRGSVSRIQGLALLSQAELNQIAGRLYAHLNSDFPGLNLKLAGMYTNFDIAPQEKIPVAMTPADTVRGISFNKNFYLEAMRWEYKANQEALLPSIELGEIGSGEGAVSDGVTVTIPETPPAQGYMTINPGAQTVPPTGWGTFYLELPKFAPIIPAYFGAANWTEAFIPAGGVDYWAETIKLSDFGNRPVPITLVATPLFYYEGSIAPSSFPGYCYYENVIYDFINPTMVNGFNGSVTCDIDSTPLYFFATEAAITLTITDIDTAIRLNFVKQAGGTFEASKLYLLGFKLEWS